MKKMCGDCKIIYRSLGTVYNVDIAIPRVKMKRLVIELLGGDGGTYEVDCVELFKFKVHEVYLDSDKAIVDAAYTGANIYLVDACGTTVLTDDVDELCEKLKG